MPETNENNVPTPQPRKKRNEQTETIFLQDTDKLIAEAERLGALYDPPNEIASLANLKAKLAAARAQRAVDQANEAAEETARNRRENLFKPLNSTISSVVEYVKSAGKPVNEVNALKSIGRTIKGVRAVAIDPLDTSKHISVAHLSYPSRTDNYAQFIEQYEALGIDTQEEMYKVATHRALHAALAQSNLDVIRSEADSNSSGELYDKLAYLDADSLLNSAISGKAYIKSKFKTTGQPYKNIAKTRFIMPSRLRKKKK